MSAACLVIQSQCRQTCLSVDSPDLARPSSTSSSVLKCHILYDFLLNYSLQAATELVLKKTSLITCFEMALLPCVDG